VFRNLPSGGFTLSAKLRQKMSAISTRRLRHFQALHLACLSREVAAIPNRVAGVARKLQHETIATGIVSQQFFANCCIFSKADAATGDTFSPEQFLRTGSRDRHAPC
jgi:hypothetical protein